MNERKYIELLKQENTEFPNERMARNLANSLESLSSDIFTEYIRFLFELIQNADDAEANEVEINLIDNYLIISHNGKAFDKKDVEAICSIGDGTKTADQKKTGYKGIGFKSVFGKSNNVSIISNGYQFQYDNSFKHPKYFETKMPWQIIPQWIELTGFPQPITIYLQNNKYNVSTVIKLKESSSLENDISELLSDGEVLLFLRNILKISISGNISLSIEKIATKKTSSFKEICIWKNGVSNSTWIVYSFDEIAIEESVKIELQNDEKTPIKLQNAVSTEISFAAKIVNGKITPLSGNNSLVFTFLPTKIRSFQFPFLINSSFLTSANREEIHDDRIWNQWLFATAAVKLIDWLAMLAKTENFSYQILHLLPERTNLANKLAESFYSTFIIYSQTKEFVPNNFNELKRASDIVVDKTGLSNEEFINNETFICYINSRYNTTLPFDAIVHPKLQSIWKLKALKSTFFDIEDLIDFFTSPIFEKNHKPEQNHLLIKYFYRESEKKSNEWFEKLKYIPFIYAKGVGLRSPNRVCFPSQSELTDLEKEVKVIHKKVYDKIETEQSIIEWLKRLGVSEVSEINWLQREIVPKLNDLNYEEDFLDITNSIFKLHKNGLLEKWHYSELNRLKLLCKNGSFIEANKCYLSDYYLPELNLENTYKYGNYVSEKYCVKNKINKTEFKHFLICIKVCEDVTLVTHEEDLYWGSAGDWNYRNFVDKEYDNGSSNWSYHTGGFSQSHAFRRFKEFSLLTFTKNSFSFAKLFWNFIIQKYVENPEVFDDIVLLHGWSRDYHTYVKNYNKWFIENEKCIPSSIGELHYSRDVFSNEKEIRTICGKDLPVFDIEKPINTFWLKVLRLRTEINVDEYLQILNIISEEKELLKSNIKRIELVYSHLLERIPTLTINEKNIISEWASSRKLLCDNGKFENANKIIWVNNKDFINKSEHLKTLFVPEKFETNTNDFIELLQLFRVKIIDKFFVEPQDKIKEHSLMRQLLVILPYFSAILERKQYKDFSDECRRLSKIIDNTEFYNASDIVLSFKNQDEIILGPSLHAYLADSELTFKGKWTSPITLYALIPEITKLFELTGANDELKLLLQLEEVDIEEWISTQGYNVMRIKETEEFKISRRNIEDIVVKEGIQNVGIISTESISKFQQIEDILKRKNITLEQLEYLIENYDSHYEEIGGDGSSSDIAKQRQIEDNEEARKLVMGKLTKEKYIFTQGIGSNSVVNGVYKNDKEFPLVVKSYKNSSWKFKINPNEWIQLSKPNAMFWVHRGGGHLEFLELKGLLRANSEFFVRFETDTFTLDDLVNFASVFRFVRNVHFQLDAPNFSAAKAFDDYRFYERNLAIKQEGGDDIKIIE